MSKDKAEKTNNSSPTDEEEWERRLATGDLPEDFLKVTEPGTEPKMAYNQGFEPETGQLVDVDAGAVARGAGASPVEPSTGAASDSRANMPPRQKSVEKSKIGSESADRPLSTEEQDRAMALALQEQLNMEEAETQAAQASGAGFYAAQGTTFVAPANMIGRLTVTVVEARLAKNYGYVKMDPYCRVRVGHSAYETPTCAKGSKEPKWNKTFNCYLLQGVKNIDVEIYDECTFTQDSLIAYGSFPIPEAVTARNEVVDEWFSMSGSEGAGKEGMIHLILSLQPIAPGQAIQAPPQVRAVRSVGSGQPPIQLQQGQGQRVAEQPPPPPQLSQEELDEFVKMFPNLDKEIILSVFQASRGNKEAMVNNLLQLGQQ